MTAFHTIAIPHDDILQGRLTMDVFAADLWEVFKGRGVEEYRNSDLFFQKTYETEGLKTILDVVEKRLKGKGGDPVLQIQTPFGGGKTHTLIAMYHKAEEWGAKRVVIVGTPLSGNETLWGLIEEQLTGKRKNFDGLVSPGRDAFRELLANQSSMLILIDELLEYITKASGVKVGESTLADQTIAFMQELTEAISSLDNIALVVTLPSSNMPNMNEKSRQLLQNLQYVSGRMEKIYTPVQEHEITKVIRLRLFSNIDKKKASKIINQFVEYAARESLLPAGVEASEYRSRFEDSYPFLPEVVDVLYHRWGSYSTFQRTRGALRLLALVIFGLKDSNIPYITLASFDLSNQEVRRELLKHIPSEFDSVIAADITGSDSGAQKVNTNLGKAYQGLKLGERVATTVFMYSFSGGMERGVTVVEIKRNATTMENPSATVAEAVEELKGRLFYIQNQAGKYFFSNQANLNHLLLVRMENIAESEIRSQEERLLRENIRNDKLKPYIWRTESADIPDTPDLKLVVLPENNPKAIKSILEEKGGSPRVHRNTLFFLVPMLSERVAFGSLIRRFLAYQALLSDITLRQTADQNAEIKSNLKRLEGDFAEGLRRLYRQIYLPARSGIKESDLGVPTSGYSGYIDQEVYDRLRSDGEILEKIAPLVIREKFLKERDWVSTAQMYQSSLKTPGEARATSQMAWDTGIAEGVRQGLFGLGEVKDDQPVCQYFKTECTVSFTDNEVLIRAEICQAQIAERQSQTTFTQGSSVAVNVSEPTGGVTVTVPADVPDKGYRQLSFNFTVPKGKVSGLMGILNYLQSKYEHMDVSLHLDRGQMTEQEYEDKVKEAFRQMGIDIK
jgi:Protein of unknown function (DUF499)